MLSPKNQPDSINHQQIVHLHSVKTRPASAEPAGQSRGEKAIDSRRWNPEEVPGTGREESGGITVKRQAYGQRKGRGPTRVLEKQACKKKEGLQKQERQTDRTRKKKQNETRSDYITGSEIWASE